jgi:hypothetical protein
MLWRFYWLSISLLNLGTKSFLYIRKIKDEFNISYEIFLACSVWTAFEILFICNSAFYSLISQTIVLIFDILRNFLILLVSGVLPLTKSYKALNIPICTTKECAANFNLLLMTEKTYDAFYSYLKNNMPEGAKFLSFWTEFNVFKHSTRSQKKSITILPTDLYEKYLMPNSESYIDFPPYLVENIHQSYKGAPKNSYNSVFDGLGEYVFETLKDYYYTQFKMSNEYKSLEGELEKDEVVYSRLVASSMVSSLDNEI